MRNYWAPTGLDGQRVDAPHISDLVPLVRRAPTGVDAVLVGGGAWPGYETPHHTSATWCHWCGGCRRVRRARAGFEIDHSERSSRVAISRAAGPSGARNTSDATSNANARQPARAAARSRN